MESDKIKLHHISEWEDKIKLLPYDVEFLKCALDHGNVTKFIGKVKMGRTEKIFIWHSDGKCYYKSRRVTELDIKF